MNLIYVSLNQLANGVKNYFYAPEESQGQVKANFSDDKLQKLFFCAVQINLTDAVIKAVDLGIDVNTTNVSGRTAISYAAAYGFPYLVQYLMDRRADINIRDGFQQTPIFYAVMNNHFNITELLVKNNADLNTPNKVGHALISYAVEQNNPDIVKLLIKNGSIICNNKERFKENYVVDNAPRVSRVATLLFALDASSSAKSVEKYEEQITKSMQNVDGNGHEKVMWYLNYWEKSAGYSPQRFALNK